MLPRLSRPLGSLLGVAALFAAALALACANDAVDLRGAAPEPPAAQAAEPPADADAVVPPVPGDEAELETLVRAFFEALIVGDGEGLWSLLSRELQGLVSREQAQATADAVRAAYADPAFVFDGFLRLTIEGDRAEFIADAYITDGGQRRGSAALAAESPPLVAVREDGRWRLAPEAGLFRLGELEIQVE